MEGEANISFKKPNRDEVVRELAKHGCYGSVAVKKALIKPLIVNRDFVETKFKQESKENAFKIKKLVPIFEQDLNARKMSAERIAELLYDINECYQHHVALAKALKEDVVKHFAPIEAAVKQATTMANASLSVKSKSCIVRLTEAETNRAFCTKGQRPSIESHRTCLVCGHNRIDAPNANMQAAERNELAMRMYQIRYAEYEQKLAGAGVLNVGRKPSKPNFRPVYYQCHCHKTHCTSKQHATKCSRCKPVTTRGYGTAACECDLCNCECSISYLTSTHTIFNIDNSAGSKRPGEDLGPTSPNKYQAMATPGMWRNPWGPEQAPTGMSREAVRAHVNQIKATIIGPMGLPVGMAPGIVPPGPMGPHMMPMGRGVGSPSHGVPPAPGVPPHSPYPWMVQQPPSWPVARPPAASGPNTPQRTPPPRQPTKSDTPTKPRNPESKSVEPKKPKPAEPKADDSPKKAPASKESEPPKQSKPKPTTEQHQELRTIRFYRSTEKDSVCEDFLDMTEERLGSKGIDVLRELAKRSNVSGLFNFPSEWRQLRKEKKKFYFLQLKGHRGWSEEDFGKIEMKSLLQYTKSKLFDIEVLMRDVQSMDSSLADEFG